MDSCLILRAVKGYRRGWLLAMLAAGVLLVTGCGGFTASPSISPATFLLPGLGQANPAEAAPTPAPEPPVTAEVALVR
ncbi:MAG: hypothetical protein D6766_11340 [Verrucomicrobia bacterium]|nr:MAG: hypothetical protein D6766_11325 [Verrucomicrobiota bacterium]RME91743.1 MAG: hypothetical protein D6766_11340 [Verrucomicrobiota bacterium]